MHDFRDYVGRRVLVFLSNDMTIDGTLRKAGKDSLVLHHASERVDAQSERAIDGDVVIPGYSVQWVQVP